MQGPREAKFSQIATRLFRPAVLTTCENRRVGRFSLLVSVVLVVILAAGCGGGTKTYSVDKSRACLVKKGLKVTNPPPADLVANAAEGGAFSLRFPNNRVIVSFGNDRSGAERIVRAYQRFHRKVIALKDVLRAEHNAVLLWGVGPRDDDLKVIMDCLSQ